MLRTRIAGIEFVSVVLAIIFFSTSAASTGVFQWPDPHLHSRIILTGDQTLMEAMVQYPNYFNRDVLIAGFNIKDVPYGESDGAKNKFITIRQRLLSKGITFGTYVSGTTVIHELSLRHFPADAVSIEDLSVKTRYKGTWIRDPGQAVIDLSDKQSRMDLEHEIRILWLHAFVPVHFVDNAAVHPRVAPMQHWEDYCTHMRQLRIISESLKANIIFSIFMRSWELNDQETKQLIDAMGKENAIALPLPWSKSIKDDPNANGWAIARYRQLLDAGIVLIMIPSDDAPIRALMKWVSTWRRPTDKIYYSTSYWGEPPP